MKIKQEKLGELREDCDFWYDITDGGYIKPEELLDNKKDAEEVIKAVEILKEFQFAYEDAIEEYNEEGQYDE